MALATPPLTAAERITRSLREAVLTGKLTPGTPIIQEEIAAQYNVSRMPVREAFRQLESENLISIYPGRGAYVTRLEAQDIAEIFEMRTLLETDALRRAIPNFSALTIAQAEQLLDQQATVSDVQQFGKLDVEFHFTLYSPAHRSRLTDLITTYRNQVTRFYYTVTDLDSFRTEAIGHHRQILTACKNNDIPTAVSALEAHLMASATDIIKSTQQGIL